MGVSRVVGGSPDAELAAGRLSTAVDHLQLALRGKATDRQRARANCRFRTNRVAQQPGGRAAIFQTYGRCRVRGAL
jgi:hypothetical protein